MARIIDGAAIARKLREQVARDVRLLQSERQATPGLAVVLVGENPASQIYVRNKIKACEDVGIRSFSHVLPSSIGQGELLSLVASLNADPSVHGILVQLPLPPQIDEKTIIAAIDPAKDVDGFHPVNMGRLVTGLPGLVPCTPQGCLLLIKEAMPNLAGQRALVIGRSNIVGKPTALLLLRENCTVTIAHSRTENLAEECLRADILVAALGKPKFVQGAWIKPGAMVIDVGINHYEGENGQTKLVGDVDFAAAQHAAAITPVPGGVGPMTIACLLQNTLNAMRMRIE